MKLKVLALAFSAAMACTPAHSALIYTFNYGAFGTYSAASISFTSTGFAQNVGDVLTYLSGDINGCAPASISVDPLSAFATPVFANGSCGDGLGPDVDGLFFRPDVMPPLTLGTFVSTDTAGRQFEDVGGGNHYSYVGGSLTIRDAGTIPEPATMALVGVGLALGSFVRRGRRLN